MTDEAHPPEDFAQRATEAAYDKFKKDFKPKSLKKQKAEDEVEALNRKVDLLMQTVNALDSRVASLQTVNKDLRVTAEFFENLNTSTNTHAIHLLDELKQTRDWWNEQSEMMNKQMAMMMSMGFEFTLDDAQGDG